MKRLGSTIPGRRSLIATVIAYCVAVHGFVIILTPLIFISVAHRSVHLYPGRLVLDTQLVLALALLYLSVLLHRRKRTAWFVTFLTYGVLAAVSIVHVLQTHVPTEQIAVGLIRDVAVPAGIIAGLIVSRRLFTVRSDIRGFAVSARVAAMVLSAAFIYGVAGFIALDTRDFHQEISVPEAIHRTIDQFDLTTTHDLQPHSVRARAFTHSLSLVSVAAVGFAFISLFQPIRGQFGSHESERRRVQRLIEAHPQSSEDFFKIWPHDKQYFFSRDGQAALAYGVRNGIALVIGDPIGNVQQSNALMRDFDTFCYTNDWDPAYIHVAPPFHALYSDHAFSLQKIGEEAFVDIATFVSQTARNKYFRQIYNRFTKQGYRVEVLPPPHSTETIAALRRISDDWLLLPGRKERTFMMDGFSAAYMQLGPVVVLRDAQGAIQGFLNQLPTTLPHEANFDLLRHSHKALGNSNDFILLEWLKQLDQQGYQRLNLGLCPLAGLAGDDNEQSVTNNALRFVYANGDRFYSFSGLHRFKAKYDPHWESRYIAYRGGIAGFTRVLTALNRAMKA